MSKLDFYYAPMSSSIPIHWALEELEIPFNPIKLGFDEKLKLCFRDTTIDREEYQKLHPNVQVPLLVVDGHSIFESAAILTYIGEKYGAKKNIFPVDPLERAKQVRWIMWSQTSLGDAIRTMFRNSHPNIPIELKNKHVLGDAIQKIHEHLGTLNLQLNDRTFIENSFSIADVMVASAINWLEMMEIELNDYQHIKDWLELCKERRAFKIAHAE